MGLWDKIKGELVDIIEWLEPGDDDTMVYRFERHDNEIKNGAKLVVREGQAAVFVNEGEVADVFLPGTHSLETRNLPILATLRGWKYGFHSPFKAEVYFVVTRRFTDRKWGTKNPVICRDAEFGAVRLRAFGTYVTRVTQPDTFIKEIVGTDGHFDAGEVTDQLRNMIVSRFADVLAENKIPVLDLAANYDELGTFLTEKIQPEFGTYGLELTKMLVENISLPPAVEEALDKRTSMGVIGNLAAYTQFQAAEAMEDAAKNPSGMAGGGMGMGMGFAMANQMGAATAASAGASTQPPPPPPVRMFHVAVGGQQTGPFDMDTLRQQAQAGRLTRDSLVWTAGMAQWQPAGKVSELAAVFGQAPPPLPPQ